MLKPFLSTAPASDAKVVQALAGVWQGTFKHKNQEGAASESTYLVQVSRDLRTLAVALGQSQPVASTSDAAAVSLVEPTIEAQPVVWDGTTLQVHSREEHTQAANVKVTVDKQLGLRLERDSRHALFTYEIRLTSVSGSSTVTTTNRGSGVLTRPR